MCRSKDDDPSCCEKAKKCQDRPLVGEIADNVGFLRVERMWGKRYVGHIIDDCFHVSASGVGNSSTSTATCKEERIRKRQGEVQETEISSFVKVLKTARPSLARAV